MKKIITLLFSTAIFATSFAQSNHRQADRNDNYVYNQRDHFDNRNFSPRERQFQIERINREFDFKIRAIQNNYTLRRHQKKVAIRNLEKERSIQIRMINANSHHRNRQKHDWRH
jgi:hypothetical protein